MKSDAVDTDFGHRDNTCLLSVLTGRWNIEDRACEYGKGMKGPCFTDELILAVSGSRGSVEFFCRSKVLTGISRLHTEAASQCIVHTGAFFLCSPDPR